MKKIIIAIFALCIGALLCCSCSKTGQSVYKYKVVGNSDSLPMEFHYIMQDYLDKKFYYETEYKAKNEFQGLLKKLETVDIEKYLEEVETVMVRLDLYNESSDEIIKQICYKEWKGSGNMN